jgi:hypothetical protein
LKNTYIEKRTLDFHANLLFKAKQNRTESISERIQKIQTLGSKFRECALQNCSEEETAGILNLSDKLRNICFIQDYTQTVVRSRNNEHFDDIAEIMLEEESSIVSKQERYRLETVIPTKCENCGKAGHPSNKCFSKRNQHVSQDRLEKPETKREIVCFKCNTVILQGTAEEARIKLTKKITRVKDRKTRVACRKTADRQSALFNRLFK